MTRPRRQTEDAVLWAAVADMMSLVSAVFLIAFLAAVLSYRSAETARAAEADKRRAVEGKYTDMVQGARERRKLAEKALTVDATSDFGVLPDGTLQLPEQLLFGAGSDGLSSAGSDLVSVWLARRIAAVVAIPGQRVLIAGHTDRTPIAPSLQLRFATNWELSAHRATNVLRAVLGAQPSIPAGSVFAAGFGDTLPLISENPYDPRNRRVEIHLASEEKAIVQE